MWNWMKNTATIRSSVNERTVWEHLSIRISRWFMQHAARTLNACADQPKSCFSEFSTECMRAALGTAEAGCGHLWGRNYAHMCVRKRQENESDAIV